MKLPDIVCVLCRAHRPDELTPLTGVRRIMRLVGLYKRSDVVYCRHWRRRAVILTSTWLLLTLTSTWVLVRFEEAPLGEPSRSLQTAQNFVSTATLLGRPAAGFCHSLFNIEHAMYSLVTCAVGWGVWFCALLIALQLRDEAHLVWRKRSRARDQSAEGESGASVCSSGLPDVVNNERSEPLQRCFKTAVIGADAADTRSSLAAATLPDSPSHSLSRRELIADLGIAASSALAAGALYKSCAIDAWDLQTRSYSVAIADLPASLDGLRIVQISDTHLGTRVNAEFIRECVARAIDLRPDLIALTGDYIHNGTTFIHDAAKLFEPLFDNLTLNNRPIPAFAVLGNHDWYGDGRMMTRALRERGVHMVDNSRVFLNADTREVQATPPREGLCLAGLGDYLEDVIRPDLALANIPQGMPCVLLSHNPDTAEDPRLIIPARRVDLQLSGHTHGGQVRLPLLGSPVIPSKYGTKYAGGLVQGPAFPVIISRGVGTSGIPVRWNVPAEVVVVELRCG